MKQVSRHLVNRFLLGSFGFLLRHGEIALDNGR